MPDNRIGLSKRTRFAVFSRDNFTCRYCGQQSDKVKLEVDHITPVCQGGTNNDENLITSCEDCNRGKGGKTIAQAAPSEQDRLRLLQEHQEQLEVHRNAVESYKIEQEFRQMLCNRFCEITSNTEMSKCNLGLLSSMVSKYGSDLVFEWVSIAVRRFAPYTGDSKVMRYVCGIRKNYDKQTQEESNAS